MNSGSLKIILFIFFIQHQAASAQSLQYFKDYVNDSISGNSFFILKGEKSCQDCYRELYTFLTDIGPDKKEINFLVVDAYSPQNNRNDLLTLCSEFRMDPRNVYFISEQEIFLNRKNNEEPYYPKLLIIDANKNVHILNYKEIFNRSGLKRKKLKKVIRQTLKLFS